MIRVGTSGWSYPSGKGTWNGVFYPAGARGRSRAQGKFDELAFYAEHFDTVEINSSFYRTPTAETAKGWADRTPRGFEFSLKLFQKFTHPEMFHKATGEDPWELGQKDVDAFRAALDPLASAQQAGRAPGAVPGELQERAGHARLSRVAAQQFREYSRRRRVTASKLERRPGRDAQTAGRVSAAWAQIDEPKFRYSIRQNLMPNVKSLLLPAAARPERRESGGSTRNRKTGTTICIRAKELKPIAEAVETASARVKKAYLYTNNHFSAKSVANAAVLKHKLGQPLMASIRKSSSIAIPTSKAS